MKKSTIIWLSILGVLVLIVFSFIGKYNTMVVKDEGVQTAWSQVENVYQRRYDLIPNLVETVKGYASHESDTLTAVTQARANATRTSIDVKDVQAMASFQQSQSGISSALGRLMVVVEKYPELKANQNFLELQSQLEGTENRIAVERKKYNESVKEYNIYIRKFPNNFVAGIFDFEKSNLFEVTEEKANEAPKVQF